MSSVSKHDPMNRVTDVLGAVRRKGVRLWSEGGQLHYRAPKGVLTQEEIEKLRVSRNQIVAILERTSGTEEVELTLEPREHFDRAPLVYSQLSRWLLMQQGEVPSLRQVVSTTHLRGRLDINALQRSIAEVVRRHEALRTQIVVRDGIPIQQIAESRDYELQVEDLTGLSKSSRELVVRQLIDRFILKSIDVAVDPLLGMQLLGLRDDEYVLTVAMEHMVSDAFSINILLRDLFTAYTQALKGRSFSLPIIPIQFADYAVWQRGVENSWIKRHGPYWNDHLIGCGRLRFPEDRILQPASRLGWGSVPLQIGMNLKAELREWCRVRGSTLVMGVFTAYVGLVLRWCNASESVVQYQFDGRVSAKVENTIGFFASVLYLRLGLFEDDNFADLLNRVTEEYCQAYEHADFSYMAAKLPRDGFTRSTVFNWVPQGSKIDLSALDGSSGAITCSPGPFVERVLEKLALDQEPGILLYDTDAEVVGVVHFPLNRFSRSTMERFGRNFLMFIEKLLREPAGRVNDILLV